MSAVAWLAACRGDDERPAARARRSIARRCGARPRRHDVRPRLDAARLALLVALCVLLLVLAKSRDASLRAALRSACSRSPRRVPRRAGMGRPRGRGRRSRGRRRRSFPMSCICSPRGAWLGALPAFVFLLGACAIARGGGARRRGAFRRWAHACVALLIASGARECLVPGGRRAGAVRHALWPAAAREARAVRGDAGPCDGQSLVSCPCGWRTGIAQRCAASDATRSWRSSLGIGVVAIVGVLGVTPPAIHESRSGLSRTR